MKKMVTRSIIYDVTIHFKINHVMMFCSTLGQKETSQNWNQYYPADLAITMTSWTGS